MPDFDPQLLFEVLKRLQSEVSQLGVRMDRIEARLTSIEDRMERMEKRQTAMQHFQQQVLVHLTGIDERIDNFTAEMVALTRRVTALETANAR